LCIAAPTPQQAIRRLLLRSLTPRDLSLSKQRLAAKLKRISNGSSIMVADGGYVKEWLRPVRGGHEWILLAGSRAGDEKGPFDYWLGSGKGKLLVTLLPNDWSEDEMIGPLVGSWRRHGPYVIGVGIDLARHSPSWADGEFDVFTVGPNGLVLRQTGGLA